MASIKLKFHPSSVNDRPGTIYYRILHRRRQRQIFTPCHIFSSEWDEKDDTLKTAVTADRKEYLLSVRRSIRRDMECLTGIIRKFDRAVAPYTADDIVDEFNRYANDYTLFNFIQRLIGRLKENGRVRTSETYAATLSSFRRFRCGKDLPLAALDAGIMEEYQIWLKRNGLVPNSISFYNRILRAVYNRAVEEEIIENRQPFRKVFTGIDKTRKRALPLPVIKKICTLNLAADPEADYARDIFLLSFMLRGMSLVDMAFLKKADLNDGFITYRRRKTRQQLTIAWESEMQAILDKYPENSTQYLLPIITRPSANERNTYRNKGYKINSHLKKIARLAGMNIPLTLYVARHSWASVAKAKGIPLSIISQGMGHYSQRTTQIYLASLDTAIIDRANSLILESLKE